MIFFKALDTALPAFDQEEISGWIQRTIIKEKHKAGQVFFLFTTDDYLLKMNRTYLNHDYYTDIITFGTSEETGIVSGELYISLDRIKENAQTMNLTFESELFRVMIHGVLHLCGYGDKTPDELETIRSKEDLYLCFLFKNPN